MANSQRLRQMIADRLRITDDDFDRAELSPVWETRLINEMVAAGYSIGKDEDFRNEWWPPDKDEGLDQCQR